MKKYAIFLGCTVPVRSTNYEQSFREVVKDFGIELIDIPSFSCCGFPSKSVSRLNALALSARNLAIAAQNGVTDVITLCNACTENMTQANHAFLHDSETKEKLNVILTDLGYSYQGEVKVRHAVRFIYEDIGIDKIKARIKNPLTALKIAAYPGCHYTKPSEIYEGFDDAERPHTLNDLVKATGASLVNYETACCGGGTLGAKEETALKMGLATLKSMKQDDADGIVLICPFCDVMFEQNQKKIEKTFGEEFNLPILYYPQLLGLAMDLPRELLGLSINRIKLDGLLAKITKATKE
jgi:heterodisulfide reductase subunit B